MARTPSLSVRYEQTRPDPGEAIGKQALKEVHAGDTLYSALEIVALTPQGDGGQVTTRATVHNQRGELVLSGEHKYLLRRRA